MPPSSPRAASALPDWRNPQPQLPPVAPASSPGWWAHVDIIGGPVTGRVSDRDGFRAPQTTVLTSFDTTGRRGTFTLSHVFRDVEESFHIRFRGSDGNRHGAGYFGGSVDPHGPIRHGNEIGDANPIFVDATR